MDTYESTCWACFIGGIILTGIFLPEFTLGYIVLDRLADAGIMFVGGAVAGIAAISFLD